MIGVFQCFDEYWQCAQIMDISQGAYTLPAFPGRTALALLDERGNSQWAELDQGRENLTPQLIIGTRQSAQQRWNRSLVACPTQRFSGLQTYGRYRVAQCFYHGWSRRRTANDTQDVCNGFAHSRLFIMDVREQNTFRACVIHAGFGKEECAQSCPGIGAAQWHRHNKWLARPRAQRNKLQQILRQAIVVKR